MCMKNVNATVNVEAIGSHDEIITKETGNLKIIPINDTTKKTKIFISFNSTIINGEMCFFEKNEKLNWQLRITNSTGNLNNSIVLQEFETILNVNEKSYYKSDLIDFINDNRSCKMEVKFFDINEDEIYFLSILAKDKKARDNGEGWTVQSAIPLKFVYVGENSIKTDKSATD